MLLLFEHVHYYNIHVLYVLAWCNVHTLQMCVDVWYVLVRIVRSEIVMCHQRQEFSNSGGQFTHAQVQHLLLNDEVGFME
mgnify:CR=1 FL=1